MDFNLYEQLTPMQEVIEFLKANYAPSDSVRIVTKYTTKANGKLAPKGYGDYYKVQDLIDSLEKASTVGEVIKGLYPEAGAWISINPTNGSTDEDVTAYKNILVEADDIPLEKQKELLSRLPIPYSTLVDSGKRSIHAIVPINGVNNKDEYKTMYDSLLSDLKTQGFPMDPANGNPSRMTRLPAVQRGEKFQHLLFKASCITSLIFDPKPKKKTSKKPIGKPKQTQKVNLEYLKKALNIIDPIPLSYQAWHKVSVAWQNSGGSYEVWLEWCQRDSERAIDLENKWKTLTTKNYRGRPVTHEFIKRMAKSIDPSFDKDEDEEEQFDIIEEGKSCIDLLNAVRLDKKDLYIYTDDEGFTNSPEIIQSEIGNLYQGREIRPAVVKELYQYIQIYSPPIKEADSKYIQFNNGILDTKTKEFIPLTSDLFIRQRIPWNYKPDAEPVAIVDKVLKDWFLEDEDSKTLFLEWAAYQLLRYTPIASFMLFIGKRRNGKSVACDWLRALVSYLNSASVSMKDLEERFMTAVFYDKLSNICDENKGAYMPEISLLKSVSAGGYINVEPKGKDSFAARCTTKMTFAFNESFRVDDRCGALKERMNVLLFNADFSDRSKQDHSLLYKLTQPEAMEYFISLAVKALWGVLERGQFTLPSQSAQWIENQDLLNNPLKQFIKDVQEGQELYTSDGEVLNGADLWTRFPSTLIYKGYCNWCLDNDVAPSSQTIFGKEIQKELGLERTQKWNKGAHYGKWFYKKTTS